MRCGYREAWGVCNCNENSPGLSFGSSECSLRNEVKVESIGRREGSGGDDEIERA